MSPKPLWPGSEALVLFYGIVQKRVLCRNQTLATVVLSRTRSTSEQNTAKQRVQLGSTRLHCFGVLRRIFKIFVCSLKIDLPSTVRWVIFTSGEDTDLKIAVLTDRNTWGPACWVGTLKLKYHIWPSYLNQDYQLTTDRFRSLSNFIILGYCKVTHTVSSRCSEKYTTTIAKARIELPIIRVPAGWHRRASTKQGNGIFDMIIPIASL